MIDEMLAKLDEIEAEMKRIGYWEEDPPDLRARIAAGEMRGARDAPSFELWLQTVFLPNAREWIPDGAIPPSSQVGLMAMKQYDYHSFVPEAHGLMSLLFEFDRLVDAYHK